MPPVAAKSRLSVKGWRTLRIRPAPSASRNAISFCRAAPRASISPATFEQAISKIIPTANISTYKGFANRPRDPVNPVCAFTRVTVGSSSGFEKVLGSFGVSGGARSEEHTSELQSLAYLVCRLLLEKKNDYHK